METHRFTQLLKNLVNPCCSMSYTILGDLASRFFAFLNSNLRRLQRFLSQIVGNFCVNTL